MNARTITFYLFVILIVSHLNGYSQNAFKVETVDGKTFKIQFSAPLSKKQKLEWSAKPDTWTDAKRLVLKTSDETLPLASVHPILKLSGNKSEYNYMAPRAIPLEGAVNFRDLGGYTTSDGRQVKWGKIFRSADVSKLTETDLKSLNELNIKMFCDFRGPSEIASAPDKLPEGTTWLNLPAGSEQVGATSFFKYMTSPERADSMMTSFYTKTDHYKAKYKPVFENLLSLETDQAIMFHCSAGKDRTGIGAALILFALGVKEDQIYTDYELTNEYRKGSNEAFIKRFKEQGISEKAAEAMMAANPKYLKATFAALEQKYGSVDTFLEKELGITADKRAILRSKFLY